MFMDLECRWPGSVHDSKVFANPSINKMLRNGEMPATFKTVIPRCEKVPNNLIGDPTYPLTPFCMKEFDICNSDEEVIFNNMFRLTKNQTECSIGHLKARWAIITGKIDFKLETLPTAIYACFILHNYCEKSKFYIDDEEVVKSQIEILKKNEENYKNVSHPMFSFDCGEGTITRKTITQHIKDCS